MASVFEASTERALSELGGSGLAPGGWIDDVVRFLRKEFADDAWKWFRAHEHDVIAVLRPRVLFITITVEVRAAQARWLIEQLAGPEPD